jgi:hypothetical protein
VLQARCDTVVAGGIAAGIVHVAFFVLLLLRSDSQQPAGRRDDEPFEVPLALQSGSGSYTEGESAKPVPPEPVGALPENIVKGILDKAGQVAAAELPPLREASEATQAVAAQVTGEMGIADPGDVAVMEAANDTTTKALADATFAHRMAPNFAAKIAAESDGNRQATQIHQLLHFKTLRSGTSTVRTRPTATRGPLSLARRAKSPELGTSATGSVKRGGALGTREWYN